MLSRKSHKKLSECIINIDVKPFKGRSHLCEFRCKATTTLGIDVKCEGIYVKPDPLTDKNKHKERYTGMMISVKELLPVLLYDEMKKRKIYIKDINKEGKL